MPHYVALGTAPTHETTVVVGPFRSLDKAGAAADTLTERGFVSELAECLSVADVGLVDWSEGADRG
jgi:hypothetical protein